MIKYERFSHVSNKDQAIEIRDNLRKLGYKSYYVCEWVVMREIKGYLLI
jgi:hypothetical protein